MKNAFIAAPLVFLLAASPGLAATKFVEMKTPGGLTFWYEARPDLPKAAIEVGWRDGLGYVLDGKEALSNIAPALMERGAGERTANQLGEAVDDLGAEIDLRSDGWRSYASLHAVPEKLAAAALIERDILLAPRLEQKELDRIKKALVARTREGASKGDSLAWKAAYRLAYGDSLWTRNFDGASYDNITRGDVDLWRKRVLAQDNMVVAASGPLSGEEFGAIIDTAFGGLPEKSDVADVAEPVFAPMAKTIVVESSQPQTVLLQMASTRVNANRERLKASIGTDVLGGGSGSRLFRKVRGELGAAYGVSASLSGRMKDDVFVIRASVAHDKALAVLDALGSEYARWFNAGIDAEEFEATRSKLVASFAEGENAVGGNARQFVSAMLSGRPPNDTADYGERLASYTPAIINAEIAEKFAAPPMLTVIVAPDASLFKADCVIKTWQEVDRCR